MDNFWLNKKVLVTGATGLVGSWLIKTLTAYSPAIVVAFIRDWNPQSELISSGLVNKIQVVNGNLQSLDCLERAINKYEIDTVFHLGAQTIVNNALRDPLETFESNIRGTYHLLEACRKHASLVKRIVIASSDKAYGSSEILPYTEEMPPLGVHPYDVSKSCGDLIARAYFQTYKLPIAIARCANIYGGGDLNWSRIIPGTIKNLLEDKPPHIRSDGKTVREYIFVKDVVAAYLTLAIQLDSPKVQGEAFNFGPNQPLSTLDIVQLLSCLLNRPKVEPTIQNIVKNEIQKQYLNAYKAEKILGWKPIYGLKEGLAETITWYENHLLSNTRHTQTTGT